MCYVEGYIKEIKIEKATKKCLAAKFTFSSDWKGKDSKLLYGVLKSTNSSDEIIGYSIYEPTDLFYTDYYADCLASKLPLHLGIYFESNRDKANEHENGLEKCKFKVTAFRVIYDY